MEDFPVWTVYHLYGTLKYQFTIYSGMNELYFVLTMLTGSAAS